MEMKFIDKIIDLKKRIDLAETTIEGLKNDRNFLRVHITCHGTTLETPEVSDRVRKAALSEAQTELNELLEELRKL